MLDISSNSLNGTLPNVVFNCLSILLNNNQLTGTLPPLFMQSATSGFDVSFNKLTGSIPESANNTRGSFVASNNQLTGSIPASLGFQRNLWYPVHTFNLAHVDRLAADCVRMRVGVLAGSWTYPSTS